MLNRKAAFQVAIIALLVACPCAAKAERLQSFTCKARVMDGVDLHPWVTEGVNADEASAGADEIDRFLLAGHVVTFGAEDCSPRLRRARAGQYIGVLERLEICGGIDNYRVLHPRERYEVDHEGRLWIFEGPGVWLHGPGTVCGNHDSVLVVRYLLLRGSR